MAFIQSATLPRTPYTNGLTPVCPTTTTTTTFTPIAPVHLPFSPSTIEAAKHAQFKSTKKHNRFRPKKHRPSDINRKPPPFNPEPLREEGLPSCYTVIDSSGTATLESKVDIPDTIPGALTFSYTPAPDSLAFPSNPDTTQQETTDEPQTVVETSDPVADVDEPAAQASEPIAEVEPSVDSTESPENA